MPGEKGRECGDEQLVLHRIGMVVVDLVRLGVDIGLVAVVGVLLISATELAPDRTTIDSAIVVFPDPDLGRYR